MFLLVLLFLVFPVDSNKVYGDIEYTNTTNRLSSDALYVANNDYMYSNTSIGVYPLVSVVDGDTIKVDVNGEVKSVRFIGINTPELSNKYDENGECFSQEAKQHLENILSGQDSVILISDYSQGDVDKYGRLLRYVFLIDWTNVNLAMILNGYAYEYTYYPNEDTYIFQLYFRWAEDVARILGRGLWSRCYCPAEVSYCS